MSCSAALAGRGVTVGVADTGIDVDMPYFYDPSAPVDASFGKLNTVRAFAAGFMCVRTGSLHDRIALRARASM